MDIGERDLLERVPGVPYSSPTFVVLPALYAGHGVLTDFQEQSYVLHEFGHGLGLGHSNATAVGRIDAMNKPFPENDTTCISNLNMKSLATAYDFLPGNWVEPPHSERMHKADYRCRP